MIYKNTKGGHAVRFFEDPVVFFLLFFFFFFSQEDKLAIVQRQRMEEPHRGCGLAALKMYGSQCIFVSLDSRCKRGLRTIQQ